MAVKRACVCVQHSKFVKIILKCNRDPEFLIRVDSYIDSSALLLHSQLPAFGFVLLVLCSRLIGLSISFFITGLS